MANVSLESTHTHTGPAIYAEKDPIPKEQKQIYAIFEKAILEQYTSEPDKAKAQAILEKIQTIPISVKTEDPHRHKTMILIMKTAFKILEQAYGNTQELDKAYNSLQSGWYYSNERSVKFYSEKTPSPTDQGQTFEIKIDKGLMKKLYDKIDHAEILEDHVTLERVDYKTIIQEHFSTATAAEKKRKFDESIDNLALKFNTPEHKGPINALKNKITLGEFVDQLREVAQSVGVEPREINLPATDPITNADRLLQLIIQKAPTQTPADASS